MKPRYYQEDAERAIYRSHETNRSTLVVMATGLGKSVLFSQVAKHYLSKGRVLCLAHRKELVEQAAAHLERSTGEQVDIEQAELWCSIRAKVVSASIQTLTADRRLERFPPDHFSLVIADEAHHYTSKSFRKILDYFTGAKVLGVTATPDRGDEKALGQVFDDVSYVMDIVDGIESGYLVPIVGQSVFVESIDISNVSTSQGDLALGELDDAMARSVEGVIHEGLKLSGDRQGVWFWPGVKSAELAFERLSALGQKVGFVYGETDKEERRNIVNLYKRGELQHLVNCAVFTEGFDAPSTSMIAMARPTKSRALYAQCCGRGTRVLPGLVDDLHGPEHSDARRALIAASEKPTMLLLDFYGNSGRHSLCTPQDVLGGDFTEEEVKLAKEKAKEMPGEDVLANLRAARAQLKAMMASMRSTVKAQVAQFDPFSVFNMKHQAQEERFSPPATPAQIASLEKFGIKKDEAARMTRVEATRLIGTSIKRMNLGLASYKQLRLLQKHGIHETRIGFKKASAAIQYIADSGWRPDPTKLQAILK